MPKKNEYEALADLLCEASGGKEQLKELIRGAGHGEVFDWIPDFQAEEAVAWNTVKTLDRKGQLDGRFFNFLRRQLPDHEGELRRLKKAIAPDAEEEDEDLLDFSAPLGAPPGSSSATRSLGSLDPEGSLSAPGAPRQPESGEEEPFTMTQLQGLVSSGGAVARVRTRDGGGRWRSFTGWLLAPSLVVVPSPMLDDELEKIEVCFDYDDATGEISSTTAKIALPPASGDGAVVLRVRHPRGRAPLKVTRKIPRSGSRLSLIAHLEDGPKRVLPRQLRILGSDGEWLRYQGPTGSGSSGAPLLDDQGRAVAVHIQRVGIDEGEGRGLLIEPFLRDIRQRDIDLWVMIVRAHPNLRDLDPRLEIYARGEPAKGPLPLVLDLARPASFEAEKIPGLEIHSRLGRTLSGHGSGETVRALWQNSDLLGLRLGDDRGSSELSISVPFIRAAEIHASGTPQRERGEEALVGVVDDGIDPLHDAFQGANGSRIVAYWDAQSTMPGRAFSTAGQALAQALELPRGVLYVRQDIEDFRAADALPIGVPDGKDVTHGTAVASIAAGSRGVAPEASITVVRFDQSTGYGVGVEEAMRFLDRLASLPGQAWSGFPLVVNLSHGTTFGPHDGQADLEKFCSSFIAKDGRVVVKSAGNEAQSRRHASLPPRAGIQTLEIEVPAGEEEVQLEVWYPSKNSYRFRLVAPSGQGSDAISTHPAERQQDAVLPNGDRLKAFLEQFRRENGESLLALELKAVAGGQVASGTWTLEVTSEVIRPKSEALHAWLSNSGKAKFSVVSAASKVSLTTPGTAQRVITVGSRNSANPRRIDQRTSCGPTRLGDPKPDLCAPGIGVRAAAAATKNGESPVDGSSYAAPHVTGAVALLLSGHRRRGRGLLNAMQVLGILKSAGLDLDPDHDRQGGWGSLNVRGLLDGDHLGPF